MKRRTVGLAAVAFGAAVALAVIGTLRFASATGPDVNNDGYVTILDVLTVARAFGQQVPTPTPVTAKTYWISMRLPGTATDYGVSVFCDPGDVVTGGGWSNATTNGTTQSYPVRDAGGNEGWFAYSYGSQTIVYAVCLDNAPLRPPPTPAPTPTP